MRLIQSKGDVDKLVAEIVECNDIHKARILMLDLAYAFCKFFQEREHMSKKQRMISAMSYLDVTSPEDVIERRMKRNKLIDKHLKPR